jgi:hypothetical protein
MSVKITPKINRHQQNIVTFGDLHSGDYFLYNGGLYQAVDAVNESGINAEGGMIIDMDCNFSSNSVVIPVDVEIKWTIRKNTKKGNK